VIPPSDVDPTFWTARAVVRLVVPATTWRADALRSREARELLTSRLGDGGAHVVVTHGGALTSSPLSVTPAAPIRPTTFQSTTSATTTALRADRETGVPGENAARIVQSIRLQWARGGGEARITLEPSHLGELTVSLKVEQGAVSVRLHAETPIVREWLQSQQQTLRQGLAEHQLTLERLEIAAPASSESSRDRDERPFRDSRDSRDKRDRRPGRDATFELEA
jgi:flagellar hook-length control protein FliK